MLPSNHAMAGCSRSISDRAPAPTVRERPAVTCDDQGHQVRPDQAPGIRRIIPSGRPFRHESARANGRPGVERSFGLYVTARH